MRNRMQQPSPSDFARWEARLLKGEEPSAAARAERQTCSSFRTVNPERAAKALEMGRQARAEYADDKVESWALNPGASDSMRQFWAKRWQPAYAGTSKVELTGADGGPVEFAVQEAKDKLAARFAALSERRGSPLPDCEPE